MQWRIGRGRVQSFSLSPLSHWNCGFFFLFIICPNPEFLHITTRKGVFYQSLAPPPPFKYAQIYPCRWALGNFQGFMINCKKRRGVGGGWWESYLLLNSLPHLKSSTPPHHFMSHRAKQNTRYDIAINQSKCSPEPGLIDAVHKTGK